MDKAVEEGGVGVFLQMRLCEYLCIMITFPSYNTILSNQHSLSLDITEGTDAHVALSFRSGSEAEWLEIWACTYHAANGTVTLYDIGQLVEGCLGECIVGKVKIDVAEYTGSSQVSTGSKTFSALLCSCEDAEDVTYGGFLTMFSGIRRSFVGAMEAVYVYYPGLLNFNANFACIVTYSVDSTGDVVNTAVPISPVTIAGMNSNILKIDMSPGNFLSPGRTIVNVALHVSFTCNIAHTYRRTLEWRVSKEMPTTRIMFRNSFGLPEVMYFYGAEVREIEKERSSALIAGCKRNYRVQDKTRLTADTGIMTAGMRLVAEDLMRSEECYLLDENNAIQREIRITGGKAKRSTEDTEVPRFEIEYEYARQSFRTNIDGSIITRI